MTALPRLGLKRRHYFVRAFVGVILAGLPILARLPCFATVTVGAVHLRQLTLTLFGYFAMENVDEGHP